MSHNSKTTSGHVARLASRVLQDSKASSIQKSLAGGALSQRVSSKQTGVYLEDVASRALSSSKYNKVTKTLAASVLSQSNKER